MEDQTNTNANNQNLLAGKYDNVEELRKGTSELINMVYNTPEKLAAFYKQLEQQKNNPNPTVAPTTEPTPPEKQKVKIPQNTQPIEEKYFSREEIRKFEQEYDTNGKLSEETYALAAKKGLSREIIDNEIIPGRLAQRQLLYTKACTMVGGEDKLQTILQWAGTLPDAEKIAYQKQLDGGWDSAQVALKSLAARYATEKDNAPQLVTGGGTVPTGTLYRSRAELAKAQADPRWTTDPAYQKQVMENLRASMKAGYIK